MMNLEDINKLVNMFYKIENNFEPLMNCEDKKYDYTVISKMFHIKSSEQCEGWGDETDEKYCYAFKNRGLIREEIVNGITLEYALVLVIYILTQEDDGEECFDYKKEIEETECKLIIDDIEKMKIHFPEIWEKINM